MNPITVPKKVNCHILQALGFLQQSRTDFVSIEDIQNRVRWSLRYTNPFENLEELVENSLRNQTDLGIIKQSGESWYALTITLNGSRASKNDSKIKENDAAWQCFDSLTEDEIFEMREILRKVKKPSDLRKLLATKPKPQSQRKPCTLCGCDM